jgi:hypothetical protein
VETRSGGDKGREGVRCWVVSLVMCFAVGERQGRVGRGEKQKKADGGRKVDKPIDFFSRDEHSQAETTTTMKRDCYNTALLCLNPPLLRHRQPTRKRLLPHADFSAIGFACISTYR